MKRPVTLLLVATLLASGAAFAENDKERFARARLAHKAKRSEDRATTAAMMSVVSTDRGDAAIDRRRRPP